MIAVLFAAPVADAHGIAQRSDLPIPAWLFAWGAGVVLIASFAGLAALWPSPRLAAAASGGRTLRVPVTGPKASPDGVRVEYRGERLAVLYRFYPLEYMQEQANVPALARATELGELTSVSSFVGSSFQSP